MAQDKPHDALVRYVWSDLPTARAYLQAVLPPELVAAVDWSSLALRPGSFVDEALRDLHTDLLFSARAHTGAPLRIYLLFEHQRTADPLMPFRLLRYMVRIWDEQLRGPARERRRRSGRMLEQPEGAEPAEPLVPIVPVVLYQGREAWSIPSDPARVLRLDGDDLARYGPFNPAFRYVLHDLSAVSDAELRGTALGHLALLLLKHTDDGDLAERLEGWIEAFVRVQAESTDGLGAIRVLIRYMMSVAGRAPEPRVVQELGRQLGPQAREQIMSWAQELVEQGIEKGIERGIEKGIEKGIEQGIEKGIERGREQGCRGIRRFILDQVSVRFPSQSHARVSAALGALDLERLFLAQSEVLRAESLSAFEAWLDRLRERED